MPKSITPKTRYPIVLLPISWQVEPMLKVRPDGWNTIRVIASARALSILGDELAIFATNWEDACLLPRSHCGRMLKGMNV